MPEHVPIVVPKAGMNMVEATVIAWRKSPGERVEAGEPVVDLETDKVQLQVQAPVAGVLREVLAAVDEDVAVGATLGVIERSV
ncbi:MAG: lipoyl domain-containing protein [Solirubrobacterales bacterium]|nr:lipoyl domain-containing protein [Solirubrobacterales bacterium]MBV8943705.1 lipoyl domain-containing protein [Solirubrobacterales bacterium]